MKNFRSYLIKESGYSIVFVFLVLILVSVLGLSLITLSANLQDRSTHERSNQSIFYIAEAALNEEKQNINGIVYEAYDETRNLYKDYLSKPEEERSPTDFIKIYKDKIKDKIEDEKIEQLPFDFKLFTDFEKQNNKQPQAKVEVAFISENPFMFEIKSTGFFENETTNKRVVKQPIRVDTNLKFLQFIDDDDNGGIPSLPKLAVQTTGDITLTGSSTIYGSVATSSGSIFLNVDKGDGNITGKVGVAADKLYVPEGTNNPKWDNIKNNVVDVKVQEVSLPEFPESTFSALETLSYPADLEVKKDNSNKTNIISGGDFLGDNWMTNNYTLTLTEDTKFKEFKIDQNNNITINIGDNTVNLLVDKFNIVQGNLKIIGTGKLNIFIKDSYYAKGSINAKGDPNHLNVYYAGSDDLSIADETSIVGSLHAQTANLKISGGTGGLSVRGNIITGGTKVEIKGGSKTDGQYIIAPNADISLLEGGHLKGVVIGKTFTGTGGTSVTYGESVVPPPFTQKPDYNDPEELIKGEDLVEI